MKILFILDYYGAQASANGVCVEKVANAFVKAGDEVSLLIFGSDISPAQKNEMKIYTCCQQGQDTLHQNPIQYYIRYALPSRFPVYARKGVTQEIFAAADRILSENDVDTVVCVHLPIESIMAGAALKRKYPNVRFSAYMLDAFSGGILPAKLPKRFCLRKKIKWENKLLAPFDSVILMRSAKEHCERYCRRFSWYNNAMYLDVPLFVPQQPPETVTDNSVLFVGTMDDRVRTPYYFLQAVNHITDMELSVSFAGQNHCGALQNYISSANVIVNEYGLLSHEQAISLMQKSKVLLNLGNKNPNLVPSKIFEYISLGKPIISTYCCDDDSSLFYLKSYPNVLLLDERNKDFAFAAQQIQDFLLHCPTQPVDMEVLAKRFAENTPQSFVCAVKNQKGSA